MAKSKKLTTVGQAGEIIAPVLLELGLELWDIRFEKEGSSWFLRYFIDKPDGVSIIDCEKVSRAVDPLLEAADFISQSYILEVGSPGIERELVKDSHFEQYIGHPVRVRLMRPVEGIRDFIGTLTGKKDDEITLLLEEDIEMVFAKNEAAYIKLYVDFETGGLS